MIELEEIQAVSAELAVSHSNVQRDYVFGWLLCGVYRDPGLSGLLVLKGGNAFRKAYFPTARYSDDLDFSCPTGPDPEWLLSRFNEVCEFASAASGVSFDVARNRVADVHSLDKERESIKLRLYFTDFTGRSDAITLSVRVDITEWDKLALRPQTRMLIHRYSDATECSGEIRCVALEEALADKMKCLLQRRHSSDLFDLVHGLFAVHELDIDRRLVVSTFLRKTIFEPSPSTAMRLLLAIPAEAMRAFWNKLSCPAESSMEFDVALASLSDGLPSLFAPFPRGDGLAGLYFPADLRNPIIQAGADRRLLEMRYDGMTRLIEPYALSFKRPMGRSPREYLYAWDLSGGRSRQVGLKSFVAEKVQSVSVTDSPFEPRSEIQLSKAGDRWPGEELARPFTSGGARRGKRTVVHPDRRYLVECGYCGKVFRRVKRSSLLHKHKDGYGNRCYARLGRIVA
ncbi:MAG: nucleotidyl transferase AbiEii/AbiGii toxin family protein [Dehalococcoidia bacterium]